VKRGRGRGVPSGEKKGKENFLTCSCGKGGEGLFFMRLKRGKERASKERFKV